MDRQHVRFDATTFADELHLLPRLAAHVAPDVPFPLVTSSRVMLSLAVVAAYKTTATDRVAHP